ncbi:MAG: thioesterase [Bacteroidia bacterium]|nr:MAG: thioesterase [Bacteroidia bacterium]
MYCTKTKIRVRYGETDRMGYVYYGNYPLFYEVARSEMMRSIGMSYRELEEEGIMMPVLSMDIKYIAPAFYDDELTVKTILKEIPKVRISFEYEIYRNETELINTGKTTLVFVNRDTMKPSRPPKHFVDKIQQKFQE